MNKLRELRKRRNLTQDEVGEYLNITPQAYGHYERGSRQPGLPTLVKLATYFEVPLEHLLEIEPSQSDSNRGRLIPVLGEVPAGHPIEAFEQIEEYIDYSPTFAMQGELFALRVKGKSMEPNILSGDIAVVLKQDYCDSGDVAVVRVNDTEVTVKQVKKQPNGILLLPRNQSFETVFFTTEQIQQLPVTIIGKVIEIRRRL